MNAIKEVSLGSVYEVAALADVTPAAVCNWVRRDSTFPAPIARLRMGPIFDLDEVLLWLVNTNRR